MPRAVLHRGRRQHLDARDVGVPAFQAVRVLGGQLLAAAGRHANDNRHVELAARHVQQRGRVVENLVGGQHAEVAGHDLDDGPHAGQRRADAGAGEDRLGQRRVADALRAELLRTAPC